MSVSTSLEGKVAIVTGASRGIGESIARTFAQHGAKVVVASRKIDGVRSVAESIGKNAHAIAAHTGKEEDCQNLVKETVATFGKVDILVNNAATNPYAGPFLNIDGGAWDKTFDVNVKGYFFTSREVARHLIDRGAPGSIVNVASIAGMMGTPLQGVYAMTKAAIISMTKTLAIELAPSNVRVNAIAPGFVKTKFASALVDNPDLNAHIVGRTPMARIGVPDEIAGGALYLAGDASTYLTGHTLVIDGGLTAS